MRLALPLSSPLRRCGRVGAIALCLALGAPAAAADRPAAAAMVRGPTSLTLPDGRRIAAEEGVVMVPENRTRPGSRQIAVHFWRVPGAARGRPPLVLLPGGPGDVIERRQSGADGYDDYGALESEWGAAYIDLYRDQGDLVFINQRGNLGVPLSSSLSFDVPAAAADGSHDETARLRAALSAGAAAQRETGADLAGYDIHHLVGDVDAVRRALGHAKISLVGGSFGSQLALAYATTHPDRVERMVLDGVEPLDHAYDDPLWVEQAMQRLAARVDAGFAGGPPFGARRTWDVVRGIAARLRARPQRVALDQGTIVTVGAEDFLRELRDVEHGRSIRETLRAWPKFIAELDRGDHRFLAALTREHRAAGRRGMIFWLIDKSLGVTPERDARLRAAARDSLLGDVNAAYRATRNVTPTAEVDDSFRRFRTLPMPVLLVQGDTDFYTPVENALELLPHLPRGRLLMVESGTHNVANELLQLVPSEQAGVRAFLAGAADRGPRERRVAVPPLDYLPLVGPSLYDRWTRTGRFWDTGG